MNSTAKSGFSKTHSAYQSEDLYSQTSQYGELNLISVKKACKQIESDANLLANRIALLKQEELKAWKKIEETKKKAREVYHLKTKNEERLIEKQQKLSQESSSFKGGSINSAELRKQHKLNRQIILESVYQQKHKDILEIRRQKEANEAKKQQLKENMIQTNLNKWHNVKAQEAQSALKKKEHLDNKIRLVKQEKEKAIIQAEEKKRKRALEVLSMEKIEMELIKKIQQTQLLQKAASEELDTALSQPSNIYRQKYFSVMTPSNKALTSKKELIPLGEKVNNQEKSFDSDSNVDVNEERMDSFPSEKKNYEDVENIEELSKEIETSNF